MRKFILAAVAASLALPAAVALPTTAAVAKDKHYKYKEWKGRDGKHYCRKPDGTTGLVVGGVAGALVGRTIDTRGDRTVGTLLGAAAGAVAGREVERGTSKCR